MNAGSGPSRAWGEPVARGVIRNRPEDFVVVEELAFAPSGSGEHLLVRVRKRGCNSAWVASRLARMTGTRTRDIGYAGRKDRWAVCEQWFSIRLPCGATPAAGELSDSEFTALELVRHDRKIRTGALKSNRFQITVQNLEADSWQLDERLRLLADLGVPNYFGEQRFGRDGANIAAAEAMFAGRRASREQRSLYLSTARAVLFNQVLDARVRDGTWCLALPGDRMMLEGSRSSFLCEQVDRAIRARVQAWDIHPTGPLWGRGEPLTRGAIEKLEARVSGRRPALRDGLERAGLHQERRSLRLRVGALRWERPRARCLRLGFRLPRGSYATVVLREFLEVNPV